MTFRLSFFARSSFVAGIAAAASVSGLPEPAQAAPALAPFVGQRPTYARRDHGRLHRAIAFAGPIQHVVVIYMENRTPDDLFGAYYTTPFPGGGTFGSVLDLHDPNATPTLAPNSIGAYFDPDHTHRNGFAREAAGQYHSVTLQCPKAGCPTGASVFSYAPAPEPSPYVAMITNFAYSSHVLQANAGPSYVAHQYSIAGQSGGLGNAAPPFAYAPYAQAENPVQLSSALFDGLAAVEAPAAGATQGAFVGNCFSGARSSEQTLNMQTAFPGTEGNAHPPCAEYNTILDEITNSLGPPVVDDWQFIASVKNGIWAAPMAINHLYTSYLDATTKTSEPFAVDPDAVTFANNLSSGTPSRPFAALTYITPCLHESDHPLMQGISGGPAWLAYVVNAIGRSSYWPNTTILVTWDDWGGFYDHYRTPAGWPYHPFPNPYNNASDTNEWGFRVPLIVISPYVRHRGYVSGKIRSQSAILNYVEKTFSLPSLGADDMTNGSDDLADLFDFTRTPAAYVPITGGSQFNPNTFSCIGG